MISMEVRDQEGTDGRDAEASPEYLILSSFSTVEKKYFALPFDGNGGVLSPLRGNGAPCSEEDNFHAVFIAVSGSFWKMESLLREEQGS